MATTVFVTGVSGFIGFAVAKTFRRQGYTVYGLVRSKEKSTALLREEVIHVIGDLNQEDTWKEYVAESGIVVDMVLNSYAVPDFEPNKRLVAIAQEVSKATNRPKTVIYTSGIGVFGDRPNEVVDENTQVAAGTSPRSDYDEWFIKKRGIHPVVIRPVRVHGGSMGMWGFLFEAQGNSFEIMGRKDRRLP